MYEVRPLSKDRYASRSLATVAAKDMNEIAALRQRAKETHPDRGGSREDFELVQEAFEQALQSVSSH